MGGDGGGAEFHLPPESRIPGGRELSRSLLLVCETGINPLAFSVCLYSLPDNHSATQKTLQMDPTLKEWFLHLSYCEEAELLCIDNLYRYFKGKHAPQTHSIIKPRI